MQNKNYYTIAIALLGAAKLILDSFGIKLITNQNMNEIANSAAGVLTLAGVFMSHIKGKPNFKAFVAKIVAKFKKKPTANVAQPATQVTKAVQPTAATNALSGLTKIAESVVTDFNQRIVNDAKSSNAFTGNLATQVKTDAVAAVESQGASFINLLGKPASDVQSLISGLIEQAVVRAKPATTTAPTVQAAQPAPAAPTTNTTVQK